MFSNVYNLAKVGAGGLEGLLILDRGLQVVGRGVVGPSAPWLGLAIGGQWGGHVDDTSSGLKQFIFSNY